MSWAEERRARRNERRAAEPTAADIDFLDDGAGLNAFAESVDAGHGMDPRARKVFVACVVLAVLYVCSLLLPSTMLYWFYWVPTTGHASEANNMLMWVVNSVGENLEQLVSVFAYPDGEMARMGESSIVRHLVIAIAGAGLALSGAVYQGAFRNALVSPSTLGVMTGGSFGMTVWVAVAGELALATGGTLSLAAPSGDADSILDYLNSSLGLALCSFAGCFVVVALVLLTVRVAGAKRASGIMLIITGQVVGGIFGVVAGAIRYYYMTTDPWGDIAQTLQGIAVSTFIRQFTWVDVFALVVPLAVVFAVIMGLRQKMMLLAFDQVEQRTLGVDPHRMQVAIVGLCTLLTAIIISFCGAVGFVGFLVPHLARRFVGPNFKYLLPMSMAVGAVFVLGAYTLLDFTVGPDYVQMTGMFISIFGAAVFLATALRGGGARLGTFR